MLEIYDKLKHNEGVLKEILGYSHSLNIERHLRSVDSRVEKMLESFSPVSNSRVLLCAVPSAVDNNRPNAQISYYHIYATDKIRSIYSHVKNENPNNIRWGETLSLFNSRYKTMHTYYPTIIQDLIDNIHKLDTDDARKEHLYNFISLSKKLVMVQDLEIERKYEGIDVTEIDFSTYKIRREVIDSLKITTDDSRMIYYTVNPSKWGLHMQIDSSNLLFKFEDLFDEILDIQKELYSKVKISYDINEALLKDMEKEAETYMLAKALKSIWRIIWKRHLVQERLKRYRMLLR